MTKDNYYYEVDIPMGMNPDGKNEHMAISVYYSLGGMNYFSSLQERRGVYVGFSPTVISKTELGFTSRETTLLGPRSGFKLCLEELTRKNQKVGEKWAAKVKAKQDLLARLAAANNGRGVYDVLIRDVEMPNGWMYQPGVHRHTLGFIPEWFDVEDKERNLLEQADQGYAMTAGIGFSHLDLPWELKELEDGSTTLSGSREDPPMRELARFNKDGEQAILYDYEFMAIRGVGKDPIVCRVD